MTVEGSTVTLPPWRWMSKLGGPYLGDVLSRKVTVGVSIPPSLLVQRYNRQFVFNFLTNLSEALMWKFEKLEELKLITTLRECLAFRIEPLMDFKNTAEF